MNEFYVLELGYSDVVGTFQTKEEAFAWVAHNSDEDFATEYVVVQRVQEGV